MNILTLAMSLGATAAISLCVNLYMVYRLRKKKPIASAQESYDCTQLLHDLTAGQAVVKIVRIEPVDMFLRSPRGVK